MLFRKKIKRASDWNKEQGKKENNNNSETENDHIELEDKDIPAMIISAIIVFGPIFIVLGAILFFVFRLL